MQISTSMSTNSFRTVKHMKQNGTSNANFRRLLIPRNYFNGGALCPGIKVPHYPSAPPGGSAAKTPHTSEYETKSNSGETAHRSITVRGPIQPESCLFESFSYVDLRAFLVRIMRAFRAQ